MTDLTPEKRAELRDAAEREWRFVSPWMEVAPADLLALLDAADERDRIAAKALRDAAEAFGENQTIREGDAKEWLRIRADKIENGGGFTADYHGPCARRCGGIRPGDRVEYVDAFLPNRHVGACPERTDETELA